MILLKILVVADTAETWPQNIEKYVSEADLVLSLGDMYSLDIKRLAGNGTPVAGVYGNHCRRGYLQEVGAIDLSRGGVCGTSQMRYNNTSLKVLGVSGCVRYSNAADLQWTQGEYAAAFSAIPRAEWVVTHCPPRGCNDHDDAAHHGIDALAEYVLKYRPSHLFHGHTYPETLVTRMGGTRIHYVHGWSVIEV